MKTPAELLKERYAAQAAAIDAARTLAVSAAASRRETRRYGEAWLAIAAAWLVIAALHWAASVARKSSRAPAEASIADMREWTTLNPQFFAASKADHSSAHDQSSHDLYFR